MNKKFLKGFVKTAISIALLFSVYTKIDFQAVMDLLKTLNLSYILIAIVLFIFSQWASSFRLCYILHSHSFKITQRSNLQLYFVGMFYNFFIPGGIGGDAYKIILLKKKFNWSAKTLTKAIITDRLIGLVAIGIIIIEIALILFMNPWFSFFIGLILGMLLYFISPFVLVLIDKEIRNYYVKSFLYSLIIQLLQIASLICIVLSIGLDIKNVLAYGLVFLISSAASVVSFSGFGAREFIFLKASEFLGTDEVLSTSIGLSFNLITALVSLLGVILILNKISLRIAQNDNLK